MFLSLMFKLFKKKKRKKISLLDGQVEWFMGLIFEDFRFGLNN